MLHQQKFSRQRNFLKTYRSGWGSQAQLAACAVKDQAVDAYCKPEVKRGPYAFTTLSANI